MFYAVLIFDDEFITNLLLGLMAKGLWKSGNESVWWSYWQEYDSTFFIHSGKEAKFLRHPAYICNQLSVPVIIASYYQDYQE